MLSIVPSSLKSERKLFNAKGLEKFEEKCLDQELTAIEKSDELINNGLYYKLFTI